MTRSIAICTLIAAIAVVLICAIYNPSYLSDQNEFLHHFVNQELLTLLGIIMTITLASAASLHLEFNKIEERYKKRGLSNTRRGVAQGAYCLIALFLASGRSASMPPRPAPALPRISRNRTVSA